MNTKENIIIFLVASFLDDGEWESKNHKVYQNTFVISIES